MEEEKNSSEKLSSSVTALADAYRNLIALRAVEYTSLGITMSIIGILSTIVVVFVLLFIGLGAAWWLGEYLHNMKAGFFIVGGFYTLIFMIVLATSRSVLIPRIRNSIIKKIYDQD